jgi:tetratricopeptide (TPR) repeat protein
VVAWQRRHPRWSVATLIVLLAFFSWAGYRAAWYFWANSHFRKAQQSLDKHDWRGALDHLERCLRGSPNNPAAHLLAARASRRLEWLDEAEEHLEACERLQGGASRSTEVEHALVRVHRGDLAAVEPFLRTAVQEDGTDAVEILDILSAALILSYRPQDAQECLDELLRRQPDHFHALVRRAWTAQSMSRYGEAITYLDKALTLRPDADTARLSLAEIQVAIGRFAEAREHLERLRERQPDNPSVLFGLARCLGGSGQKEQAIQFLDQLLAKYPNDWKALSERGWLCELDHPAEAETYLRRAESLAPPDLPLLVRLADCLRLLGKADEARGYREKADRLKADFQRAADLGDLIREKNPNDPALRHELACILVRLGKQQDALHWFQTALEKEPTYRPTHESLAALYEKVGDYEHAAYHRRILQRLERAKNGP